MNTSFSHYKKIKLVVVCLFFTAFVNLGCARLLNLEHYPDAQTAYFVEGDKYTRSLLIENNNCSLKLSGKYFFFVNRSMLELTFESGDTSKCKLSPSLDNIDFTGGCLDTFAFRQDKNTHFKPALYIWYLPDTLYDGPQDTWTQEMRTMQLLHQINCVATTIDISKIIGEERVIKIVDDPKDIKRYETLLENERNAKK